MTSIPLSLPHMGGTELDYIREAFEANYIAPAGAMLDRFEQALCAYTSMPHCVAVASGTAALQLILHHYEIGPGDPVWAPTMTFIGGVSAITHRGAIPTFVDCDDSYTIDTALLDDSLAKATEKPKAIIATDLFGQSANWPELRRICDTYGIPLIADSAEGLGSTQDGSHSGTLADVMLLSFNGNKIITTSGGGAILSRDQSLIDHTRKLSTQARENEIHYQHEEVGYNFRLSNICAAIGVGQMEVLDARIAARRAIFNRYNQAFQSKAGLSMMPDYFGCAPNRWLSILQLDAPSRPLVEHLNQTGIEARPVWKPMHCQPVYQSAQTIAGQKAESLYETGLCLPSASQMIPDEQDIVIKEVLQKTGIA